MLPNKIRSSKTQLLKKKTPKPVLAKSTSPYIRAREEWLERYGSYIKAAAQWRFFALGCAAILLCSVICNVIQASQHKVIPFIVQTDNAGKTHGINRLEPQTTLPKEFIQAELAGFIQNWRSVTADFDLQRRMINKLSAFTGGTAKSQLKEWFEANSPYLKAKNGRLVQIEIKGLPLPVSKDSWRVEWQEITRSHTGLLLNAETFEATVSVRIHPPDTEAQIMLNPGGVIVTEISVSRVLNQTYNQGK